MTEDLQSKNPDVEAKVRTAQAFTLAREFLAPVQRTGDYFVGYSLAEALHERATAISNDQPHSKPTQLERLDAFKKVVLDAIDDAKNRGA